MQYTFSIIVAAGLLTTASAHGLLTSPQPRLAGPAMEAACGRQVYNNQASDSYGNIQGELQVAASQTDYDAAACNIWLCKGYKFADNTANVQSWTAGQVVDFKFDVRAPHTGYANVSIVNTATNTIIGDQLLFYSDFGDNSKPIPANETSFSVTIPSDLGSTCSTAGACVLQHYWNAASINQTYESCVDFTVGGFGSSDTSSVVSSAASVASSPAAVVASSSNIAEASSSVAVAITSTQAAGVVTSSSAAPTTLQTVVKSSIIRTSTSASVVVVATGTADEEDGCWIFH